MRSVKKMRSGKKMRSVTITGIALLSITIGLISTSIETILNVLRFRREKKQ